MTAAIDIADLGPLLAERRRDLGLSQLQVDQLAGIPVGYTGRLERGAKHYGPVSLPATLKALGVGIAIVPLQKERLR